MEGEAIVPEIKILLIIILVSFIAMVFLLQ
jgi:hypothetical protein